MKKSFILSLLLLLSLFSCYKDELIVDDSVLISIEHEEEAVSGHIVGQVTDEFGKVMDDHTAYTGNQSFPTNNYGLYHFELNNTNKNATQVQIDDGQISWNFSVKLLENEVNYFRQSLFTQKEEEKVYSDELVDFSFTENSKVYIEADAYLLEGESYTGEVELLFVLADLKNPFHLNAIPGDRRSLDPDGKQGWLVFRK